MGEHARVVSRFFFEPALQEQLRAAAQGSFLCIENRDEFWSSLQEAEVICASDIVENWRERAPKLRWLQYPAAGVDRLRNHSILAPDSGVTVTTASGIHAVQISEYVLASMLVFNRSWPTLMELQKQHLWPRRIEDYNVRELELAERTLGIVGLGHIGRRIALLARAFSMKVLGTHFSAQEGEQDKDVDELYPMARLHDLLKKSDYIVLSVPLTNQTEGMIGEEELRVMQPHTYLVNIARGKVIDEAALIRALREGWIAGAGLDVASQEPLPAESPLYDLPNVILTPHISGASSRYAERFAALFADNLRHFYAGEPLQNVVEQKRGY